ncbi:MAG: DNA-3-methyladenine glycosylase I [Planctomycetaceae bacterium]|nr:DNA-3-methyladenine glycosylase I [Planctomycetaceae bacterium]
MAKKKSGDIVRCGWCGDDPVYTAYHDEEWGVPVRDDGRMFEFLILEGAQAGLSWITILRKREAYRNAFAGFDPEKIARFGDADVARLLGDAGIVRNRLKIAAAITNAQAFLRVVEEKGSFADFLWGFVDNRQVVNRWKRLDQIPATSPASDAMSKELKRLGFKFVGSTILYAHMQATGLVNDHLVSCFRHGVCCE